MKINRKFGQLPDKDGTAIWTFAGLAIVFGIVLFKVIETKTVQKSIVELLTAPKTGDVYEYESSPNNYSTMRIVNVTTDSIFFLENQYETSSILLVADLDLPENYYPLVLGIPRTRVDSMYQEGAIVMVERRN